MISIVCVGYCFLVGRWLNVFLYVFSWYMYAGSWVRKSCSCSMGTMGMLLWYLVLLGIRERIAGIKWVVGHLVHSKCSLGLGRVSVRALVRSACAWAILPKVEGEMACPQCLQSIHTTMGRLQPITSISHLRLAVLNLTFLYTVKSLLRRAIAVISSNSCQQSRSLTC